MPKSILTKRKSNDDDDEDFDEAPVVAPVLKKKPPHKKTIDPEQQDIEHEEESSPPLKKNSKKKTVPCPDPEPDDDEVDDAGGDEGDSDETLNKKRKAKMRRNKKAKLVGYRSLARSAGYIDRIKGDTMTVSGVDGIHCLTSISDAKRLMRFTPAAAGSTNFGLEEYTKRHGLFEQGIPNSAARETQARCDAALRSAMNQAVMRAAETGKKTISASLMMSVLRPYSDKMLFTAVVPPIGLIRHAQDEGVLAATEKDKEMKIEEKKENIKTKQICEAFVKKEEERKAARRKLAVPTQANI